MSKKVVKYRNQMMFRTFTDFYDAILECDGVVLVRTGEMSNAGNHETIFIVKTYDPTTHEMKVDGHSRDGFQEFRIRVDPQKARSVYEFIQKYKTK